MYFFRLKLSDATIYFHLEDILRQTPIYEKYLKSRKTLRGADIFTGYLDAQGQKIFTRDKLVCQYLDETGNPFPERIEYTVKSGKCLEEHMYGCSFDGFYLEEKQTKQRFSLLDELRNSSHTPLMLLIPQKKPPFLKRLFSPLWRNKLSFLNQQRKLHGISYLKLAQNKARSTSEYLKKISAKIKKPKP